MFQGYGSQRSGVHMGISRLSDSRIVNKREHANTIIGGNVQQQMQTHTAQSLERAANVRNEMR